MNIYKITYIDKDKIAECLYQKKQCYVFTDCLTSVERIFKNKYPNNEITNIEFKTDMEVLYD